MNSTIVFALLLLFVTCVFSHSTGAPESACFTMTPMHGAALPQTSQPPVMMQLSANSIVGGTRIQITIRPTAANPNFRFRGFMIQARRVGSNEILGTFVESETAATINCSGVSTTSTHRANALRNEQVIEWISPQSASYIRLQ